MKYGELHLFEFAPSRKEFDKILNDSSIRMGFECELVTDQAKVQSKEMEREIPDYNNMPFGDLRRYVPVTALRRAYERWKNEQISERIRPMWEEAKESYTRKWLINHGMNDPDASAIVRYAEHAYDKFEYEHIDEVKANIDDVDTWIADNFGDNTSAMDNYGIGYLTERDRTYTSRLEVGPEEVYPKMAQDLKKVVNVEVVTRNSGGSDVWHIIEDGSLRDNNVTAEVVSSVYQLGDGVNMLNTIFDWMQDRGYSTNDTTGLHVSFSIEGKTKAKDFDFLKMMVLFDENYTADLFNRLGQHYCDQMRKILFREMHGRDSAFIRNQEKILSSRNVNTIAAALKRIGSSLQSGLGFREKYYSFRHRSNGVVEFRSMGGTDYEKRFDVIRKRIVNMAYLMKVGSNPEFKAREYIQGIYKMLTSNKYSTPELGVGAGRPKTPPALSAWMPLFDKYPTLAHYATETPMHFLRHICYDVLMRNIHITPLQIKQLRTYIIRNKITPERVRMAGERTYNPIANLMGWPMIIPGDERQQTLPNHSATVSPSHEQSTEDTEEQSRQEAWNAWHQRDLDLAGGREGRFGNRYR